jgi:Ni/Fe-hydrogenase 1 B-type cytochrome subunit
MTEQIRRVAVWSGWLRLAHWSMAGAALVLLATGWLIAHSPAVAESAAEVHYLGAGVLVFALALRVFLGFSGAATERFGHMLPRGQELAAMRASLLFYLSLGRAPLPNWFAHNPLWKPVYLFLLVVLGLSVLTGWLMPDSPLIGRLYLPRVHTWLANTVAILTAAHLFSVILQDLKGKGADISAMISGHRYFAVERDGLVRPEISQVSIPLDELGQSKGSQRND